MTAIYSLQPDTVQKSTRFEGGTKYGDTNGGVTIEEI